MSANNTVSGLPFPRSGNHASYSLLLAIALATSIASGCRTKPPPSGEDIRKSALPAVVLDQSWKAPSAPEGLIQDDWLASFQDAQLESLAKEAVTNNPDLRVAATRVEQANNYVEMAKAALRPAIGVYGTGGIKAGGGDDLTGALQGIMLGASWEPDLWGRLRYARNAAQEVYVSTREDVEFARQSLAAATAKSWFTATETLLQREIAEDTVRSAEELVKLAIQRAQVGAGSEREVALARASLGNFQDALLQIHLSHQQSLRSIELLLGRYPAAELSARPTLTALPGPVPAGIPLQMLERRPDLLAAEHRVDAAFNQVGAAKASRLPRIVLNASVGALNSDVLQLKQDFSNPTAGAGARLIAPIYQGGALKTQVQIQQTQQRQAIEQYASMALRAIGDVENTLAAEQTLAQRAHLLEQVVAQYQRALELSQSAYRIGKQDLRSVEEQQLTLYSARIALLHVQSEQLSQRVNLHLALGGSFDQPPAAAQSSGS